MIDTHGQGAKGGTLQAHCIALYGQQGLQTFASLQQRIAAHAAHRTSPRHAADLTNDLTERDAMLIAYGDHVREPDTSPLRTPPLRTLGKVCETYLGDAVPCLHILPFYPYTSDDGFSVADYRAVDPALGTWADIRQLAERSRLMFDAVINHASTQHAWFQGFLQGDPRYQNYFVTVQGNPDLSQVVRPRTLPLLTPFQTAGVSGTSGTKQVWTTFSADQVDLNYQNPQVMLEIVDLLLFYAAQGAEFIRLDAIAYLWKEIGTPCIHLPQTHLAIQLMRAALDEAAPQVKLITETNVPHVDNIAYFGDGTNEAQLVYNFALPPLTLHTLRSGDASVIAEWASQLVLPTHQTTFFNFLASHDGIGLNPARGILSEAQIDDLVTAAQRAGGRVGYKTNSDGTQSPYELNINYFDALADMEDDTGAAESSNQSIDRFIAAHAIMFSLIGMPGIYFHSLFGSRGWPEGVAQLGHNRAINREKLNLADLEAALSDRHSRRWQVLSRLTHLLRVRGQHAAFDPYGKQTVVKGIPSTLVVQRIGRRSRQPVLCLINVTGQTTQISLPWRELLGTDKSAHDLVGGGRCLLHGQGVTMAPYQIRWLTP